MTFSTPGHTKTVTADQVILALPFAVLRTSTTPARASTPASRRAITQLGAGRNAKLQLQFSSRYWNTRGPWRPTATSTPTSGVQNTWDVTRGQSGATGILVDYSGGNVAGRFSPSTPYSNAATNPQVTDVREARSSRSSRSSSRGSRSSGTGRRRFRRRSSIRCSTARTRTGASGSTVGFAGYEGVPQGNIHFAGEHTSQDFQGFMEGGASEGARAADEVLAAI